MMGLLKLSDNFITYYSPSSLNFEPNYFIIRLSPLLNEDGLWTGELKIGTITTEENNLDINDYDHLMFVSTLVSACIPLMEERQDFRDILYNYTNEAMKETKQKLEEKATVESREDNVINVKFH